MIFVGFILGMKRIFDPNDYVCIVISPLLSLNRNHAITFEKVRFDLEILPIGLFIIINYTYKKTRSTSGRVAAYFMQLKRPDSIEFTLYRSLPIIGIIFI